MEGARLRHVAPLIRSACASSFTSCSLCAHTGTALVPGATPGGATNERHMPMNPVDKLLKKEGVFNCLCIRLLFERIDA